MKVFGLRAALLFGFAALLIAASLSGARAGEGGHAQNPAGVWTIIIPDAYPNYVYTWHVDGDGSYAEDGVNSAGEPIQATLSGHWSLEGAHLTMRQDHDTFVFEGVLAGGRYWGTLYLDGREISHFCAARGEDPPDQCDDAETS